MFGIAATMRKKIIIIDILIIFCMELHPSNFILRSYMAFFFQIFKISIENIRVDINLILDPYVYVICFLIGSMTGNLIGMI